MSKKVDWSSTYKGALRGKRTAQTSGYSSRKEQVSQAYERLEKAEAARAEFEALQPALRQSLLEHMVARKPITVVKPMSYFTEGLAKSEEQDEIDRAFYNRPSGESGKIPEYQVMQKAIAPGTVLTFLRSDAQLGQWIFKSSAGGEVEIYDKPTIMIGPDTVVQNPGFWGLLAATNIYTDLLENSQDESG